MKNSILSITDINCKICLNDPTPIKLYVPHYSQGVREEIWKKLEKKKEANFIEPSISSFAAFMVRVKKSDSSLWITIEFQMVNKDIINNSYPPCRIDSQIVSMRENAWFSTINLTKGIAR